MPSTSLEQVPEPPVHRALASLPEAQRELIALVYWAGLTRAEIALRLGVSATTLEARTRRALRALADLLDDERAIKPAR